MSHWVDIRQDVQGLFEHQYKLAKESYLEWEVWSYQKHQPALIEFEAAFSHVVDALLANNDPKQDIREAAGHLQRLAVELREQLAEDRLLRIRRRIDPSFRRPWISRLLLFPPVQLDTDTIDELNSIKTQIAEARYLKGKEDSFDQCYTLFNESWTRLKAVDGKIPDSPFMQRIFAVILTVVSLTTGLLIRGCFN